MRGRLWIVAIAGLVAGVAPASSQSLPVKVFNDVRYATTDMLAVWISPFRGSARDYATTALIVGGVGVTALFDDEIGDWIHTHQKAGILDALKPFREQDSKPKLVDLGAGRSLVEISAGLYVVGLVANKDGLRDAAIGCLAAEKSNGLLRHYLYKVVSRERPLYREIIEGDTIFRPGDPYDIRTPSRDPWWDNSFFGGHGANAMSCASFINHRFELGLFEPVLWTVALGINFGRVADERHWMSDAMVGGVVGFAIGKYVAKRSLDRKARRSEDRVDEGVDSTAGLRTAFLDGLYIGPDDGGIVLGWRRRF